MSRRALLVLCLLGCDDAPTQTEVLSVDIVAPAPGARLGCVDDLDRATQGVLEYDVVVHVGGLTETDAGPGLSVSLDGVSAPVPPNGIVEFPSVALPPGEPRLRAELVRDGAVVATDERVPFILLDAEDPGCTPPAPVPSLSVVSPPVGSVFAGDDDGTLADGLQIELVARVDDPLGSTVRARVGEFEPVEAPIEGGVARFARFDLPLMNGVHVITVSTAAPGTRVRAEIGVEVAIDGCRIEVAPTPVAAGCDFTGPATIAVRTDCATVRLVAGDLREQGDVVDGAFTAELALPTGSQTVEIAVWAGDIRSETQVEYAVGFEPVSLALDPASTNVLSLAEGDAVEGGGRWVIEGQAPGLPDETPVTLTFDPPLPVPPAAAVVRDERFTLVIEADYYCAGTVSAQAGAGCGGASPAYPVCFDGVRPRLSIESPAGPELGADDDADPERPGLQIDFAVVAADARPLDVDYPVVIACAAGAGPLTPVSPAVMRSALADTPIRATVPAGPVRCVAQADAPPNGATSVAREFAVDFGLAVLEPAPRACFPGQVPVRVAGVPVRGAGVRAALLANDEEIQAAQLDRADDAWLGVLVVPVDGEFEVRVTSAGSEVSPAAVPVVLDQSPPAPQLVAPAPGSVLALAADAAEDCVETTLQLRARDANPTTLCYALNGAAALCRDAPDGSWTTPPVALGPGRNQLVVRATDCAGNTALAQVELITEGCRDIVVTDPAGRDGVNRSRDEDEADGCQFDLLALAPAVDAADVVVCSDRGVPARGCADGAPVGACAADEGDRLRCRVDVPDGAHSLTLVTDDGALRSTPVQVVADCTAPRVVGASIPESGDDACVNAAERRNAEALSTDAEVTVEVEVEGVEDGQTVRALAQPSGAAAGQAVAEAGRASIPARLPTGTSRVALIAVDRAGNESEVANVALQVDAVAPAPRVELPLGDCLNASADQDPELEGLQTRLRGNAGGGGAEGLSVAWTVDGAGEPMDAVGASPIQTALLTLADGPHETVLVVRDACGNAGSAAGFAADGAANPRAFTVDTAAPTVALRGVEDDATLTADDDLDPEAPGLQVEVTLATDGLEPGQPVRIFAAGLPAVTEPAELVGQPEQRVLLTLAAGLQSLRVAANDACGNAAAFEPIVVDVQLD